MSAFHPYRTTGASDRTFGKFRLPSKADTRLHRNLVERSLSLGNRGTEMRMITAVLALAGLCATNARAQPQPNTAPVTIESYYKLGWGTYREWLRLFDKNEAPVLAELQRQGLLRSYAVERPFTHLAGDERWDVRVRATYRDAEAAVGIGGSFDKAWEAAIKKLFPNASERQAEERQRATMVEEHWDVIVMPHGN